MSRISLKGRILIAIKFWAMSQPRIVQQANQRKLYKSDLWHGLEFDWN